MLVCLDRKYQHFTSQVLLSQLDFTHFVSLSLLLSLSLSLFLTLPLFAENLKIVNLQGKLKSNKKLASELSFDFCIESVGKFEDSFRFKSTLLSLHVTNKMQASLLETRF